MAGDVFGKILITLMVSDFEQSFAFYTETLGLETVYRAGNDWAEVRGKGTAIGIHGRVAGGPAPKPSGQVTIGFQVDNLEDAMESLKARGVDFPKGIGEEAAVRIASFTDPDGTALYLYRETDR